MSIDPEDLQIDICRHGEIDEDGWGSVGRLGYKITHIPSGKWVSCHEFLDEALNREVAMKKMEALINEH